MVNAWGFGVIVTGGGSVCRALVGNSFTLPAQTTQLDVTADISIEASFLAIALLGAAGGGLDYWLRVDRGDGSGVIVQSVVAGQVIAPVLWTTQWQATVQQRITARIGVAAGPADACRCLRASMAMPKPVASTAAPTRWALRTSGRSG